MNLIKSELCLKFTLFSLECQGFSRQTRCFLNNLRRVRQIVSAIIRRLKTTRFFKNDRENVESI